MYRVEGDQIILEFLGQVETGTIYARSYGRIRPDGSFTIEREGWGNAWPGRVTEVKVYDPMDVGEMQRSPDW